MKKIEKFELMLLKAYLELPARKLLNHKFELEEDYIAEHVAGFIEGERFEEDINIFLEDDLKTINNIISLNINNEDGKNLLTAILLTKIVCNIMNKYKKS
ncbi:MAG TPA: hypothetical protein H9686_02455 [Firmicutes bacterium]|nr:hypothetical protein [Bacillota bacterium]